MNKALAVLLTSCALSLASAPALAKDRAPKKKLPPVVHVCKKNDSSVNALACNIYMESRGESVKGQLAVGFVTLNRLRDESFPGSVRKVVYQKSQFSWTRVVYNVRDKESWRSAKDVAKVLYNLRGMGVLYDMLDVTKGSLYFHAKDSKPYWTKYLTKVVIIDDHVFYKPKEKTT